MLCVSPAPSYQKLGSFGAGFLRLIPFNIPHCTLQDRRIMDQIASYFSRDISEIECDDEDSFLKVLNESIGASYEESCVDLVA